MDLAGWPLKGQQLETSSDGQNGRYLRLYKWPKNMVKLEGIIHKSQYDPGQAL